MEPINVDVLVVGAGMSGLMAANALQEYLLRVIVIDKEPDVGGRLATQRIGPGRADHGAQFFTTRTPEFQRRAEQWLAAGVIYRWSTGWSDGSLREIKPHGHFRYAVHGGMSALASHLAQGLDVRLDTRVTTVAPIHQGWQITDEQGQVYTGRGLILTPPVPESLALLGDSQVHLSPDDRTALKWIKYEPGLSGLFWVDGPVYLPDPGAVQLSGAAINWIADNQRKGISPGATIITVQTKPGYSRRLGEAPDEEVLTALEAELQPFLDSTTKIVEAHLKRWLYAMPTSTHTERSLLAANLPPLVFAGDAFGGPLIEGAALSGLDAAEAIRARLAIPLS